ncbi:MAG TPA: hypothetical protein V6D29_22865 [Leptolyngbyaceae cyanobacterium]
MRSPNQRLLRILGLGWLAFIGVGLGLRQALQGPATVVVIDRSYCEPGQWLQVAQSYEDLYSQSQARQIRIEQVILINDLGEEVLYTPPDPLIVQSLSTYGRANPARLQALSQQFSKTTVLSCSSQIP